MHDLRTLIATLSDLTNRVEALEELFVLLDLRSLGQQVEEPRP